MTKKHSKTLEGYRTLKSKVNKQHNRENVAPHDGERKSWTEIKICLIFVSFVLILGAVWLRSGNVEWIDYYAVVTDVRDHTLYFEDMYTREIVSALIDASVSTDNIVFGNSYMLRVKLSGEDRIIYGVYTLEELRGEERNAT